MRGNLLQLRYAPLLSISVGMLEDGSIFQVLMIDFLLVHIYSVRISVFMSTSFASKGNLTRYIYIFFLLLVIRATGVI